MIAWESRLPPLRTRRNRRGVSARGLSRPKRSALRSSCVRQCLDGRAVPADLLIAPRLERAVEFVERTCKQPFDAAFADAEECRDVAIGEPSVRAE